MSVVGIDPGVKGGIVVMSDEGDVIETHRMPIRSGKRDTLDLRQLRTILTEPDRTPIRLLCVEQVGYLGLAERSGPVGVAALARTAGQIEGLCVALDLPYEEVPPQTWQKLLVGVPHPHAPKSAPEPVKSAARKAWKTEIMNAARRRWPRADLVANRHPSAKESSGIADSLWIAEYARLRVMGTSRVTA